MSGPQPAGPVLLALRRLLVLTVKELRQLVRDRVLLYFILYIFTVDIFLAGSGGSRELHNAGVLVHDADRTVASRELVYRFQQPYFRFAGEVRSARDGLGALDRGEAVLFLEIPEGYQQRLQQGKEPESLQLLVDASKANRGYLASSYATRIVGLLSREVAAAGLVRRGLSATGLPTIESRPRIWFNPELNEAWFRTVADLLAMMTVACILLPASAMVREKERGTIEQLLVSPLTPLQVMLPKVVAMTLVMLVGTAVSLFGIMHPLYGVPIRGSVGLFFALTALYAFTNAGLGLVAATFARNAAQVGMLILMLVMPMILLSGSWTPLESMPPALRLVMNFSPMRHFIQIAYGILLRGEGMGTLWDSALAMALLGAGLFTLGAARFRRQFR